MHLVLYLLAALTAAAGIMLIGFGIPINEFSLGNTLIIAGTIALTAGVLAFSLAIVNRQLKRVADLLGTRPVVPARAEQGPEPVIAPVRPTSPRPREPAQERPFAEAAEEPAGFGQPRFRPGGPLPASEPAVGHDDLPPLPRTPQFPQEPPADRRGWRPPGAGRGAARASEGAPEAPRGAPAPRAPDANFDSIWPNEPQADAPQRPSRAEGAPGRPNGGAPYPDQPSARGRSDAAPASVLKSGVVDGMAYTLYTDGSIEAELAQGVVRFGSIEELRNHLEKSS